MTSIRSTAAFDHRDCATSRSAQRVTRTLGVMALFPLLTTMHVQPELDKPDFDTHLMRRAPLTVRLVETGTVESSQTAQVTSQVEWRTTVIDLVPEGAEVEEGDIVVRLDSSEIEQKSKNREVILARRRADLAAAIKQQELQKLTNERRIAASKLSAELAVLDLEKFKDGEFLHQKHTLENSETNAREQVNFDRANLEHSRRMLLKGFTTHADVADKELKLLRSQVKLNTAREKKDLYVNYDYESQMCRLEGQAKLRKQELERVEQQKKISMLSIEVRVQALTRNVRIHEAEFERLQRNIAACTLTAPCSGQVIYAREGRRDQETLELGDNVRYRQELVSIPNLKRMSVTARVHESQVEKLSKGQPVVVRAGATGKQSFTGRVSTISALPLPPSRYARELCEFAVNIEVDPADDSDGTTVAALRPGMTAEVEIDVARTNNVLQAPVESVISVGESHFAFVVDGQDTEAREVVIGMSDDNAVEIIEGLEEGEQIVTRPRVEVAEALSGLEDLILDRERSDLAATISQ